MKKVLFFFLLVAVNLCYGQNYQCLQGGVKHYFTNNNGYLRGIRIDSAKTLGDTTVYYPFHTPRCKWSAMGFGAITSVDTNGGSWLGKEVVQLTDGTFLFDNIWGDTVVIKTQANIGETWIFCRDTTATYYKATLTGIDTMSFLGFFDSVKIITVNTYHDITMLTSDSLNGFQIVLSKHNGFVQVFDLYTFPYHKADTAYNSEFDFYLALSLSPGRFFNEYHLPGRSNSLYQVVNFINPTTDQLFTGNTGDVYETIDYQDYMVSSYTLDTIITKTILSHTTTYASHGITDYLLPYPGNEIPYGGSFSTSDTIYLFDTSKMPEEIYPNNYSTVCNYYFPSDSSYCVKSPAYIRGWVYGGGGLWGEGDVVSYKIGFGQTDQLYQTEDPSSWEHQVNFVDKSNQPCGSFHYIPPLDVPVVNTINNSITIYPNPAATQLTIQSAEPISGIVITNVMGQRLYTLQTALANCQLNIDVSQLPPGVYLVRVNDTVRRFVKK